MKSGIIYKIITSLMLVLIFSLIFILSKQNSFIIEQNKVIIQILKH